MLLQVKSHRSLNNGVKFFQAQQQAFHFVTLGVLFPLFVVPLNGKHIIVPKIAHILFITSKWFLSTWKWEFFLYWPQKDNLQVAIKKSTLPGYCHSLGLSTSSSMKFLLSCIQLTPCNIMNSCHCHGRYVKNINEIMKEKPQEWSKENFICKFHQL